MEVWIGLVFVIFAALALAAFIVGQVWLARRFRRPSTRHGPGGRCSCWSCWPAAWRCCST